MVNLIKILVFTSLIAMSVLPCFAQSIDDTKKQINDIKKKTNLYLYGEVTARSEQEAKDLAEGILYGEINKWSAGQKKLEKSSNLLINNKKNIVSALTTPRGNMFRCFVYVKKSDIQKVESFDIIENTPATADAVSKVEYVYPDFVREIAGITDYSILNTRLKEAVQNGEISDYASTTFPAVPQDYYFVIYNQTGRIIAVLSKGETRTNIGSGEQDSLQNYKGYKAIGFKL